MTYIKIVILDGLDVAMNPNVAVATAESDEQIREAENKTADASMSNAPTIDLIVHNDTPPLETPIYRIIVQTNQTAVKRF